MCGFNYGAGRYDRVRKAFWFCVKVASVGLLLIAVAGECFAPQVIGLFRKGDLAVTEIGTLALRLQCIFFPLMGWTICLNMLQQNIGKSKAASILSSARQGLFFIPTVWILALTLGLPGIQMAQMVADLLTFLCSVPIQIWVLKKLSQPQK